MSASPAIPDSLGERFEVLGRAGSGGMSEVFRARDQVTGEIVAVKVMLEGQEANEARFGREVEVLSELSHPAIVRYAAHGFTPQGRIWIALEWLDGEDLAQRLRRGPLSIGEAIKLGRRVAGALGTVHARNIVHRDLKPSNLFLEGGDAGRVKVLDFGIARLGDRSRVTRAGTILGTAGYMAPEQLQSGTEIGPEADVFALGCVLFEALAGRPAFNGELVSILAKVLFEEAPRVVELRPEVPADLDDLVARMLEKDPRRRPQNGAEVASALTSLGGAPPSMATPSLVLHAPSLGGGERRVVSLVLVSDHRAEPTADGPTLLVGEARAERETLREAVETHQGRAVSLVDGSTLVTIAGDRIATDQAACAARCALALRALLPADMRISVATGRGESDGRRPLGVAVDRAARLLAASSGSITVDEVTAGLLDARFDVREREGGEGFELCAEHAITEGARTVLGKPTACVGRDRELHALITHFEDCVERPGAAAALITAAAGVGKSRLAHEVMRAVRERAPDAATDITRSPLRGHPAIWFGRGDPLRAGSAFALVAQVIRSAAGIEGGEPLDERRNKLRERVARHVPEADRARVTGLLGELAGAPFPDETSPDLRAARQEPALLAESLRRAFLDFLLAESTARPLLVVLEDLHWGDAATVRLVDTALRDLADQPFLVLALSRPEIHDVFPRLWADRPLQAIRLMELGRRASERLVRQVLGESVGPETVERLVSQAGGHAFYLEELIRAAAEGHAHAAAPLPETVLAMVEARLAGLEDEARRTLRAASVFGEVFWDGGVAALLGGPERAPAARARLAALVEREVLIRRSGSRFAGETEYAFRHALLREGAYATLTEPDRALGHRLAAAWLERVGEADPAVLAEHFERGGEPRRTVPLLVQAAMRALMAADTDQLMARAQKGLAMVRALPERDRAALREAEVAHLGMIVEAHGWRAEWREALGYSDEILALAEPGSLPWTTAATGKLAMVLFPGAAEACAPTLEKILAVDFTPGAASGLGQVLVVGAYCLLCAGRSDEAVTFTRRADAAIDPVRESEPVAAGWMYCGRALRAGWIEDDPWSATQHAAAARASFESAGHLRGVFLARYFMGMNLWSLGARDRAVIDLRAAAEAHIGYVASHAAVLAVNALADTGALDPARALATRVLEAGRAHGFPLEIGRGHTMLALVHHRAGDLDAAEREARAAIETLAWLPFDRSVASATLAAILLDRGERAPALAAAEEAMALHARGRTFGYRGDVTRLVHVEALRANGRDDEARAALAEARTAIHLTADRIADPEARSGFLAAPERARLLALDAEGRAAP